MSLESGLEREVRDIIRRNRWLTLSTASPKGMPQSSLVVYASDSYTIYILTGKTTAKIRNILRNPRVSVTIPFYTNLIHRLITIAPPAAITFRARAETREFDDSEATEFYEKALNFKVPDNMEEEGIWIICARAPGEGPQGRQADQTLASHPNSYPDARARFKKV